MKKIIKNSMVLILVTILMLPSAIVDICAMQIFVKVVVEDGYKHITLEVEPTDRIEDAKAKLYDKLDGVELENAYIELIFAGKVLEEGNTLQDYSVQKDSTLSSEITYYSWYALGSSAINELTTGDYYVDESGNVLVYTAKGLAWVAVQVNSGTNDFSNKFISLANHIDLLDASIIGYDKETVMDEDYNGINNWLAIGSEENSFKGMFDGNGYTISNIYINTKNDNQGLFGYVEGGTISSVGILDSYIIGGNNVGELVGSLSNSDLSNCFSTSYVSGVNNVGGILGYSNKNNIKSSYFIGDVSAQESMGAIIGNDDLSTTLNNCYYNSENTMATNTNAIGLTTEEMTGLGAQYDNMSLDIRWKYTENEIVDDTIVYYYPALNASSKEYIPSQTKFIPSMELEVSDMVYGSEDSNISFTTNSNGIISYTYYSDLEGNDEIEKPSEVGTYYVQVSITGTLEYASAVSDIVEFDITHVKVIITVDDQVIVRGEELPAITYKVDGLLGEDTLDVTLNYEDNTSNMIANTYAIDVEYTNKDNYAVEVLQGTLTVNEGYTVTINDTVLTDVAHGSVLEEVEIPSKEGYYFIGWYANNKVWDFTNDVVEKDMTILAMWIEKEVYDVLEGLNQTLPLGNTSNVTYRIDAPYNEFLGVYINNELLDTSYYYVSEGSTIITFTESYLETLAIGTYEYIVEFEKGSTVLTLTITEVESNIDTGDTTNTTMLILLMLISLTAGLFVYFKNKKK